MAETPELTSTHLLFTLIGAALMAFVGVFIAASTLIAPVWAVVVMGVLWAVAAVWAWLSWRRRMFAPLLASIGVGVMWIVFVNLGDALLDWSA